MPVTGFRLGSETSSRGERVLKIGYRKLVIGYRLELPPGCPDSGEVNLASPITNNKFSMTNFQSSWPAALAR